MWQRLYVLCQDLTGRVPSLRQRAWKDLFHDDLLRQACVQAIHDGLSAAHGLATCYTYLVKADDCSLELLPEEAEWDLGHVRRFLAAGVTICLAYRCSLGEPLKKALLLWTHRIVEKRPGRLTWQETSSERPEDPAAWVRAAFAQIGLQPEANNAAESTLRLLSQALAQSRESSTRVEDEEDELLCQLEHLIPDASPHRSRTVEISFELPEPFPQSSFTPQILGWLGQLLNSSSLRTRLRAGKLARAAGKSIRNLDLPQEKRPAIPASLLNRLVELMTSPTEALRADAIRAAASLSDEPPPGMRETLQALLADPVDLVREAVADAIGILGSRAGDALVRGLAGLLRSESGKVRLAAIRAVGSIPAEDLSVICDSFLPLLDDPEHQVRMETVDRIGKLGAVIDSRFVDALLALLVNGDTDLRAAAIGALGQLGPEHCPPDMSARLTQLLTDPSEVVRTAAARAAGRFAQELTPELAEGLAQLLDDPADGPAMATLESVTTLGRAVVTPALLDGLARSLHRRQRSQAALKAVGVLGPASGMPGILEALARLIGEGDQDALETAKQLGPALFRRTLRAFADLFCSPRRYVRDRVVRAVMRFGPELAVPDFLDELVRLLRDDRPETRATAAGVAEAIGPQAGTPGVLAALNDLLDDDDSWVRYKASQAVQTLDTGGGR